MKLSKFKQYLGSLSQLNFIQLNGDFVPTHFHITEAGLITKHFIDCGGTVRTEKVISFQVWVDNDLNHRLEPEKLRKIINIAEPLFEGEDLEIEIEYQIETIGRFSLDFDGQNFLLIKKQTTCLAKNHCDIQQVKTEINSPILQSVQASCCTSGSRSC